MSCKSREGPSINNWERSNWEILVKWINHFWVCVFIWSLQILHDHRLNRSDRTQFYPSDQGRLRESSRLSGSFAIVRVPRRRRPRKRRLKSEFALFQSLSWLLELVYFVKCKRTFLSRTPKNHIQVQNEKENQAVGCLRPLRNVKLGIFPS